MHQSKGTIYTSEIHVTKIKRIAPAIDESSAEVRDNTCDTKLTVTTITSPVTALFRSEVSLFGWQDITIQEVFLHRKDRVTV